MQHVVVGVAERAVGIVVAWLNLSIHKRASRPATLT
jgi:hypothetical protein